MAQAPPPSSSPPATDGTTVASDGLNLGSMCSLYIGDLDFSVTDSQLYDYFTKVCQVVSVRVCRDSATNTSLGYGYVNYSKIDDGFVP